ncbi:MAG: polysaccharide biosynthesis/export family protein [Pseudomonadota bacterium]
MKSVIILLAAMLFATGAIAQSNYRIQAGDTIRIEVLEDPELNRDVLVLPDGSFSFPFAGNVSAGGRSLSQVQSSIAAAIAPNFASTPSVFASISSLREEEPGAISGPTIEVYFLGEVNTPGLIEMRRGTTFLQGLAQAGGFDTFAAQKRVQLRRTNARTGAQRLFVINYKSIANGAALSQNIKLHDGDVILVPERRLFE